jgi:uncharacterized protein
VKKPRFSVVNLLAHTSESNEMKTSLIPVKPWYREPWPWLLMSGPAIVVVAGIITIVLAVRTQDGLVVDDYYKRGLAVNKDLSRDLAAKSAGLYAKTTIDIANRRVTLDLVNAPTTLSNLTLTLSRASVVGHDQLVTLQRSNRRDNESTFVGTLQPLEPGKWYATLEEPSRSWRLMTTVVIQGAGLMSFSMGHAETRAETRAVAKP